MLIRRLLNGLCKKVKCIECIGKRKEYGGIV